MRLEMSYFTRYCDSFTFFPSLKIEKFLDLFLERCDAEWSQVEWKQRTEPVRCSKHSRKTMSGRVEWSGFWRPLGKSQGKGGQWPDKLKACGVLKLSLRIKLNLKSSATHPAVFHPLSHVAFSKKPKSMFPMLCWSNLRCFVIVLCCSCSCWVCRKGKSGESQASPENKSSTCPNRSMPAFLPSISYFESSADSLFSGKHSTSRGIGTKNR